MGKKGPTSRGDSEGGDQLPYPLVNDSFLSQDQLNKDPVVQEALQRGLLLYILMDDAEVKQTLMARSKRHYG